MTQKIDVTVALEMWDTAVADVENLCRCAAAEALAVSDCATPESEISVLLCDDDTVSRLNGEFRGQARPTNVLSFPIGNAEIGPQSLLLGDVAIAFETVAAEALSSQLSIANHLTHLVVHGVLHLLGYDHHTTREADKMEALEVEILDRLGVDNPYVTDTNLEVHASPA